jgi:hypothetical protein
VSLAGIGFRFRPGMPRRGLLGGVRRSAGHGDGSAAAGGRGEGTRGGRLSGQGEEVAAGFGHAGLNDESTAVTGDGVAQVAECFQDDAKVIPGGGAGGVELEGVAEEADGILDGAGLEEFEGGEVALAGGRMGSIGVVELHHR